MNKTCQSGSFLEGTEDNFAMWVTKEWMRMGALLHLTFTNKKEWVRNINGGSTLAYSDNDFRILRGRSNKKAGPKPWTSTEQSSTFSEI